MDASPESVAALKLLQPRFSGKTCFCLATGPSASTLWNGRTVHSPVVVVNDAYRLAPGADILYGADQRWWSYHWWQVCDLPSLKLGYADDIFGYERTLDGVLPLVGSGETGFDERLGYVRHGWNSGHQAVHLCAQLGAKRIILVGFDMHTTGGTHFFGEHPREVEYLRDFPLFIQGFKELAEELDRRGVEVLNATPGSALPYFPFVSLECVL